MSAVWDTDYLWREFQGAKLASLFGLDHAASQGNESFQFTAPKQPRKTPSLPGPPTQKPAPPPGDPSVLLATAVQAFRFVNGQYVKQGRVGAAILGSHSTREFRILIYGTQQKQITTAKIHQGFVYTVQPGNYGTFYDDQRQNWSLMFDSERAGVDFCKEVCVARRNGEPAVESLVTQDLALGEGHGAEHGDTVEVAFTGWLLHDQHIGQMFDSNTGKDKLLKVKLGAGKAIKGLEEGMLGMQKNGRRLLIVPPSLAYGSEGSGSKGTGHVPPASTLVYDVEIRRVKFAKDSPSPCPDDQGSEQPSLPPASIPAEPGGPLQMKPNPINEQVMNPDAAKAKLISRMAKMGQPMLPFLTGAIPAQPDSDTEDHSESPGIGHAPPTVPSLPCPPQPTQMSAPPPHSLSCSVPSHPAPTAGAPTTSLEPVSMETAAQQAIDYSNGSHAFQSHPHFQCAPLLHPLAPFFPPQVPSDITSFMMTEARQHNTEIRLAIGKVGDKIDLLASKVGELVKHGGGNSLSLSSMSMETGMIVHNVQRIVQENMCLKKEVLEKSTRVEEQNWKIGELIEQNQRYMEQSSLLLEQRSDALKSSSQQSQTRLLQAEQDMARLAEDLAASSSLVSQLQQESSSLLHTLSDAQARLRAALLDREGHCAQIGALERRVEELKQAEQRAQTQGREEKHRRKERELRTTNLEDEIVDLTADRDNLHQLLSDRKRKWQQERQRLAEELEEVRRRDQQEADGLRLQLHRTRRDAEQGVREQMQAELEAEFQARYSRAVSQAQEQLSEVTGHRDRLAHRLAQLQEEYTKRIVVPLKGMPSERVHHSDMERQVKRVMSGLFHSLRGQFVLRESYQGGFVLGVILSTIRSVTLELLMAAEEEEEEEEEVLQRSGTTDEEGRETCETRPMVEERASGGVAQTADGPPDGAQMRPPDRAQMRPPAEGEHRCSEDCETQAEFRGEPFSEPHTGDGVNRLSKTLACHTDKVSGQSEDLTVQNNQSGQFNLNLANHSLMLIHDDRASDHAECNSV